MKAGPPGQPELRDETGFGCVIGKKKHGFAMPEAAADKVVAFHAHYPGGLHNRLISIGLQNLAEIKAERTLFCIGIPDEILRIDGVSDFHSPFPFLLKSYHF